MNRETNYLKKFFTVNFRSLKSTFFLWLTHSKLINSKCLKSKILFNIFPFLKMSSYKNIIETKIEKIEENPSNIKDFKDKLSLDLESIKELLKGELERKKIIDDKSKANLFAITISATIVIGSGVNQRF